MTALPVPDAILSGPVVRVAALMEGFSLEATRPSAADIAALAVLEARHPNRISAPYQTGRQEESVATAVRSGPPGLSR